MDLNNEKHPLRRDKISNTLLKQNNNCMIYDKTITKEESNQRLQLNNTFLQEA